MKRVVITGLGIISSIGNDVKTVLKSLQKGRSGVVFSSKMRKMGLKSNVWGNIKNVNLKTSIHPKEFRFMNDASAYTYLCMKEAIKHSNLNSQMYERNPRIGVIAGSSINSPKTNYKSIDVIKKKQKTRFLSPYSIIKTMCSNVSACLANIFKLYGVNYSISSACASSAHCIGHAFELIQLGKQDIIFSGGGEEINWELASLFDAIGALSTRYNSFPSEASRAYDKDRDGFVISGGGGIIVIEELNHALLRGAKIYAEIIGYAANSDGYNMVLPSIQGAVRCMKIAMKASTLKIDYLNTHGTSTFIGDIKELYAISQVFNNVNEKPMLSSTKSITGHALGASGVQEIIYTILMINHKFIAPSINIKKIDPLARNMNIVTKYVNRKIVVAMSNNFGFGGTNATIIVKKFVMS